MYTVYDLRNELAVLNNFFYFAHRFMYKKRAYILYHERVYGISFFSSIQQRYVSMYMGFVFLFRDFFPIFFPTIITGSVEHVSNIRDYDVHKPLSARVPRPESS